MCARRTDHKKPVIRLSIPVNAHQRGAPFDDVVQGLQVYISNVLVELVELNL